MGRKIEVDFLKPARDVRGGVLPERKHGGCGAYYSVPPYNGPASFDLKRLRHFRVSRVERSPTGSGLGSFRIDEVFLSRREEVVKARGFHCSYPDYEACVRVADGIN